jgi:hypothetical protein
MKLVVDPVLEPQLADAQAGMYVSVLEASGPETCLILENCTLEAAFNSPALNHVAACEGDEGAQVGLSVYQPSAVVCQQLLIAASLLPKSRPMAVLVFNSQVTMTNCKFIGFRRAVVVMDMAQVNMKDCLVELTTQQPHAAEVPVVSGFNCSPQQCWDT